MSVPMIYTHLHLIMCFPINCTSTSALGVLKRMYIFPFLCHGDNILDLFRNFQTQNASNGRISVHGLGTFEDESSFTNEKCN